MAAHCPVDEPPDLERFVLAQAPVIDAVRAELAAGRKRSHWMWFVFPQLRGLGRSPMAWRFGLSGANEARLYLAHPVLGPRLREAVELMNGVAGSTLSRILGSPDDMKFRSSMTLFARVAPFDPVFGAALDRWCGGMPDPETLRRLAGARPADEPRDA